MYIINASSTLYLQLYFAVLCRCFILCLDRLASYHAPDSPRSLSENRTVANTVQEKKISFEKPHRLRCDAENIL
jgi:hypothetical protein